MFSTSKSKHPKTLFEKLYRPVILFTLLLAVILVNLIQNEKRDYKYSILPSSYKQLRKLDSGCVRYLDSTSLYSVKKEYKIAFKSIPFSKSLFFPEKYFILDSFYLLFGLVITAILIFTIVKQHRNGIFGSNIAFYTKLLKVVFGIMFVANLLRNLWLRYYIKKVTNGVYIITEPFDQFLMPEFWIFTTLVIVTYILKKGETLQKEQDLTI